MSYNISSDRFDNPLLKDLLKELNNVFESLDMNFYVIGATARDIILNNLHDLVPERKTVDLDIAIAISDWNQFQIIEENLIAKEDGNIYWLPDETIAMSVWGFPEMADAIINIEVDGEFTIKTASLPGLFMLKLVAWNDRHLSGSKDAYDMVLLLTNYLDINTERAVEEHYDLYEAEKFDLVIAGARLMAKDIKLLVRKNEKTMRYLIGIISKEIKLAEESPLINQLLESDASLQYEQVLSCLESILEEWES